MKKVGKPRGFYIFPEVVRQASINGEPNLEAA